MSLQLGWKTQTPVSRSSMNLPKKMDGDVDWPTLGNILVAHALGEVVCASYVDSKYGKREKGVIPDTNWKYAYEELGVVVLVKEMEDSSLKCYMGRSVIDLPPNIVHECISVNENTLHWDKYAVESREVESLRCEKDIKDGISYMRHESRQCLVKTKRDFLFYVRNQHLPDTGKRVMSVLSVDHPSFPPVPGVDRAQIYIGSGWVLEPYDGDPTRTLVSYLAHTDLTGLPSLVINRVISRQPLCIHYLRRYLTSNTTKRHSLKNLPLSSNSSRHNSSNSAPSVSDGPLVTPEIPTPEDFHDHTGYTFSAVTLGSNPLYNWSISSTATAKNRDFSSLTCSMDVGSDTQDQENQQQQQQQRQFEESESVMDFGVTSIEGIEKLPRRPLYTRFPYSHIRPLSFSRAEEDEDFISETPSSSSSASRRS